MRLMSLTTTSNAATSYYWSFPATDAGTVVGGYTASTAGGTVTLLTDLNTAGLSFYWVSGGTSSPAANTVEFQYCVNGTTPESAYPQCSPLASATFNVFGPTPTGQNNTFFTATPTPGAVNVYPPGVAHGGKATNWWLQFGNNNDVVGISFAVAASAPAVNDPNNAGATNYASFQWVQLIGSLSVQGITNPATPDSAVTGPLLDNWYPYAVFPDTPNSTNDSPGLGLVAYLEGSNPPTPVPIGELAATFSATMYLMWDPALPSGCHPASTIQTKDANGNTTITSTPSKCTGSIPVPLGNVTWGFCGDAINTVPNQISNNQQWLLPCGWPLPAAPTVQSSSWYPQWAATITNAPTNTQ